MGSAEKKMKQIEEAIFSSEATLSKQTSVRLSVCQPRLGGNVIF